MVDISSMSDTYSKSDISSRSDISSKRECNFCSKKFTRKIYYDRHILICELLSKSQKERKLEVEECEDTPTVHKLYEIIMEMSVKYKKLEEKVEELSKYVDSKKKKINVINWLNTTYKNCEVFDKWIHKIKVERKHLELIFSHDFIYGSLQIIKDFVSTIDEEHMPIRSYDQKDNVLYVFDKVTDECADANANANANTDTDSTTWREIKQLQFDKMMDFISKQILHEFVLWQNENKHRMEDDNYAMIYMTNVKKINGGNNSTTEQLYKKIHRELYKSLKYNLKNVIQYEIV